MVTAYTTALPPSALPPLGSVVVVVGSSLVFAVLLAVLAFGAGVVLQSVLAAPSRRRPSLRLVEAPVAHAGARRAA